MAFLRRVKSLTKVHSLGNSSHTTHGSSNPKQSSPIKTGKRMANHVQAPHKPDANPYGLHQAQLNDARRAVASSTPYNPRAKKSKTTAKRTPSVNDGISVLSKRYKRVSR